MMTVIRYTPMHPLSEAKYAVSTESYPHQYSAAGDLTPGGKGGTVQPLYQSAASMGGMRSSLAASMRRL